MISERLSHVDSAQAALLDIEQRRLSTTDMYHHALMVMGRLIDQLVYDMKQIPTIGGKAITDEAEALLHNTFSAVTQGSSSTTPWTERMSTRDIDLKLIAYSRMRDGVSTMYQGHHGREHEPTCLTCVCLCKCAGMIAAVEKVNAGKMAVARTQVQTLYRGHLSHRASVIPKVANGTTTWHAQCPTCGLLSTFPTHMFQGAQQVVTKHRRAAATLTQHVKQTP